MSELKYKVGDKVLIKSIDWYNENKNKFGEINYKRCAFTNSMTQYCDSILTIVDKTKDYYWVDENMFIWTDEMIEGLVEEETKPKDMGEVSDGYHTFNELYEYRMLYNAALFNEFAKQGLYDVHKSRKHSDGEYPFGDSNWFIVMAELPTGQISNHYEMKDWDKFQIPEKPLANKWDEHSPKDVAERLTSFTNPKKEYPKTFLACCDVLNIGNLIERGVKGYKAELFDTLQKLYICRDAYWKIAGEEMGLGKPWKPDWTIPEQVKYAIYYYRGGIKKDYWHCHGHILAFPTEGIRDEFYENFKIDIERCKELL